MASRNFSIDLIKDAARSWGVDLARLEFKKGGSHWKVLLDGKFIMILPMGNPKNQGRAPLNDLAQLRRALDGKTNNADGRHR